MCEQCYKFNRCFEQRGICSEYRNIEDIRAEIEAVMRAYKVTGDEDSENRGISGDRPRHQAGTERLFLETEIQEEVDKEKT